MLQLLDEEVSNSYKELIQILKDKDALFQSYIDMASKGKLARDTLNTSDAKEELHAFEGSVQAFSGVLEQVTQKLSELERKLEEQNDGVK